MSTDVIIGGARRVVMPLPPSVNSYWERATTFRGKRIMRRSNAACEFLSRALVALRQQNAPSYGPGIVIVDIYLHHRPQGGDRDNYNKGILDALTHAEVWDDDSQVLDVHVHKRGTVAKGAAVIDIRPATEAEIAQADEVMVEVERLQEWGLA